ncbi:G protein-coupled receptor 123-like protein [Camelus ferus]|nr:G protein-coupled receptor 123-like protein [Camelus ferus]
MCAVLPSISPVSTSCLTLWPSRENRQAALDLRAVLSLPQAPGEFLHPVVYACTAVMLLCLLASAATYVLHRSAIRISRKGRHALLNFCFHAALTFSVFAGGINRTKHPTVCQAVGIVLHYSTLSTMLWIGVTARNIYKQVTKKAPLCPGTDQPPYPKQPLLRTRTGPTVGEDTPGRIWEDQGVQVRLREGSSLTPVSPEALGVHTQELASCSQTGRGTQEPFSGRPLARAGTLPHVAPRCPLTAPRWPLAAPSLLRAAAFTLFLFVATWTFGALAVSQGHFLDMVFSCLYGAFCVTLGLFVLIHHCAKRDDVWHCWWSCCPSRRDPHSAKLGTRPALDANGDVLGHAACLPDSPCPGKPLGFGHPQASHCKMTNLQATQSHVSCLSPATPCCAKMHCEQLMEDTGHIHVHEEDAFGHDSHLHRCPQGRTKPHYFSQHQAAEQEYAYHIPSSLDGSPRSSRTDSPPSSLEGPVGPHSLACCAQGDPFPLVTQPEGSDASPVVYGCPPLLGTRLGREVAHGPGHFEMLRRTQSLPFGGPGQNGLVKGDMPYGSDSTGNIRTGPWRNETTV